MKRGKEERGKCLYEEDGKRVKSEKSRGYSKQNPNGDRRKTRRPDPGAYNIGKKKTRGGGRMNKEDSAERGLKNQKRKKENENGFPARLTDKCSVGKTPMFWGGWKTNQKKTRVGKEEELRVRSRRAMNAPKP